MTGGGTGNGTKQNPYVYKSAIQDRATGLQKFGTRWYSPVTGTSTQQDTLDTPLDPANANRYAYAGDGPVNNADPSGERFLGIASCVGEFAFGAGLDIGLFVTLTAALSAAPETGGITFAAEIVESQVIAAGFAVGTYAILDAITRCD